MTETRGKDTTIQRSMSWSLLAEAGAKLVTPVTNMLLARILLPSDFGVLAVCNMLISFVDIITDAGFAKYLIQADFKDENERSLFANVAFWSNFSLSVILATIICLTRNHLALLLGNPQYAAVISVASLQLLLTSVSSIQMGILRRGFEFKKLFYARIAVAVAPLLIAVPIAFITRSYWALIIGNLAGAFINAFILTLLSPWRPSWFYSWRIFRKMFSYSFWSLCEGLANWAIFWIDTFIITGVYSEYYVGLYKNSANMVMSIMGMITAAMSPVLLSVLSRVKNDFSEYKSTYMAMQRLVLYLALPMGVGLFCYRHVCTYIVFGSQWDEASNVLGAWGLMMMLSIVFYSFPAELYKSKGVPKILFASQILYLIVLVPACWYGASLGFWPFVYIRCACVLEQIVVSLVFLKKQLHFASLEVLSNTVKPFCATSIILFSYIVLQRVFFATYLQEFVSMVISGLLYCLVVVLFFRKDLLLAKNKIQRVNL